MHLNIHNEINEISMVEIIKHLPSIDAIYSEKHSVLIHGLGGQPLSFYKNLKKNKSIDLLWSGWSSSVWWTYLLYFIPGHSGLVKVLDRKQLSFLYLKIGEQSMCGLYFVPNEKVHDIFECIKKNRENEISKIFEKEENFFLLTIDFDYISETRNNELIYRELIIGNEIDSEIKKILIPVPFSPKQ